MARYMLDSNMCIDLMKHRPPEVAERFAQCYVGDVVTSAITFAELQGGVAACPDPDRERANLASLIEDIPVAPFNADAALAYGTVRLATRDGRKDHLDTLIGAHALALGVVLVSNNEKDFARYPGLVTENWLGRGPAGDEPANSR